MEIPEISLITDFEAAGMKCLQNPSFISPVFSLSTVTTQVVSFWKWGAVILAILATFSSLVKRIKIIHIRRIKSSSESLLQHLDIDLDLTDDEDDDGEECTDDSSRASSENEDDDGDDEPASTMFFHDPIFRDRDFRVKGSSRRSQGQNGHLRFRRHRRKSESCDGGGGEFSFGNTNVVKLWDSLGLSLGFDSFDDFSDSESVVSLWDFDQEKKISDVFGGLRHSPAVSMAARPVVLSAKVNDKSNGVVLGAYDTRMGGPKPALYAEWGRSTSPAKAVGVKSGGVETVYVADDVSGILTVGDVRKANTPLITLTETDGDMWWDADAVILEDDFVDSST